MAEQPVDIACTLGSRDAIDDRLSEWHDVVAHATGRESTGSGLRLTFPSDSGLAEAIARLAVLEQRCCAFFTFTMEMSGGQVTLEVSAPEGAEELVEGLLQP